MVSIDVQTPSMTMFFFESQNYRYYVNNLATTSLTSTIDFSDMKLFPGTQHYSTTANWCTHNGNIRDLFLYYGVNVNNYIKNYRGLRNFFRQPDAPFMQFSMNIDDQTQPNEITTQALYTIIKGSSTVVPESS